MRLVYRNVPFAAIDGLNGKQFRFNIKEGEKIATCNCATMEEARYLMQKCRNIEILPDPVKEEYEPPTVVLIEEKKEPDGNLKRTYKPYRRQNKQD